jgi:glycosyltransferase involved in cell wall biosynthesis
VAQGPPRPPPTPPGDCFPAGSLANKKNSSQNQMANNRHSELVSVIIPTYRGDRFIEGALASVAAQTWPDWEIIVVEDGSQGQTESIVRHFADQHPNQRVEYVRHPKNLSQSAARNTALRLARGAFVAFLDVDDRWQPAHLSAALAALIQQNNDVAYSTVIMFDDASEMPFCLWGPRIRELASFPYSLFHRNYITPSCTVMRRELCNRVGDFEVSLRPCEDLDYWLRCAVAGARFVHVKGCHVLYRKNHEEAQTRGISLVAEAHAQVIERHILTFENAPFNCHQLAARLYFTAAWYHASLRPDKDPSADPSLAQALFRRAISLHSHKTKYWIHGSLLRACERLRSSFLRSQFLYWFQPRKFRSVGQSFPSP